MGVKIATAGLAFLTAVSAQAAEPAKDKGFETFAATTEDKGFSDSIKSKDGTRASQWRPLGNPTGMTGSSLGVWTAGPGVYRSEGELAEVFVVTHGQGEIWIQGGGTHALKPGVIISTPSKTPAEITIPAGAETFRKVSIVDAKR